MREEIILWWYDELWNDEKNPFMYICTHTHTHTYVTNPRCWYLLVHTGIVGSSVYVSNTTDILDGYMCFNDSEYAVFTIPPLSYIPCSTKAQYVIYYNEKRPGVWYPDTSKYTFAANMLCEVEVYGNLMHLILYSLPNVYDEKQKKKKLNDWV